MRYFYPRPPGGGRLRPHPSGGRCNPISIHALRVEGDKSSGSRRRSRTHFYPRPPGGGRHVANNLKQAATTISIHALRVEGDRLIASMTIHLMISIHALRVEGDNIELPREVIDTLFLSTPSGWRATAKTDKVFVCFCAKGRRICLFKTRKEKNLPVAF